MKILNGTRANTYLEIHSDKDNSAARAFILEDEAVHISISLPTEHSNISLILHDTEIPFTSSKSINGEWTYEWNPKPLGSWGHESIFHNYYGLAELVLCSRVEEDEDLRIIEKFQPIDVLAKKINSERVEAMLNFLAVESNESLLSFFRVTRLRAGFKEGDKSVGFLIEQLERCADLIRSEIPKICSCPIARLNPTIRIVPGEFSSRIDETTLAWLSENSDVLSAADDYESAIMDFEGELYSAYKLQEATIQEDVDVYENRVLHGFVVTLIRAATDILSGLETKPSSSRPQVEVSGYSSFFSQINRFIKSINSTKIERCRTLLQSLHKLRHKLIQDLPVTAVAIGRPLFTQKARFHINYQRVFNRIISWHRFGAPDWSAQEELFSIQSIPKLFEYYVLFLIKKHIEEATIGENKALMDSSLSGDTNTFAYKIGSNFISLSYETKAWTPDHNQSESECLVNTEGWTTIERGNLKPRGSSGPNSNRCPDYLIRFSNDQGEARFFILDAKYTKPKKAFNNYLPELTMKYLHGMHEKSTGRNLSVGLMVICPDFHTETRHFHHPRYSIYGETPVSPAMLVGSVSPGDAEKSQSTFGEDILQIIKYGISFIQPAKNIQSTQKPSQSTSSDQLIENPNNFSSKSKYAHS